MFSTPERITSLIRTKKRQERKDAKQGEGVHWGRQGLQSKYVALNKLSVNMFELRLVGMCGVKDRISVSLSGWACVWRACFFRGDEDQILPCFLWISKEKLYSCSVTDCRDILVVYMQLGISRGTKALNGVLGNRNVAQKETLFPRLL